jgi:tRNA threonylcarbamoyladenosine biosynthesis protein TsaE
MKIFLQDEAATTVLAEQFQSILPAALSGMTVLLEGELGAGKSTFARGLIRAMGHSGPVPSPTYTLVEPYQLSAGPVYHIDLYRVSSEGELRFLGWNELDDGLRLVEWPDRAPELSKSADVRLELSYDGAGRCVQIDGLSQKGDELLAKLESLRV